jgi:hypothetical protein
MGRHQGAVPIRKNPPASTFFGKIAHLLSFGDFPLTVSGFRGETLARPQKGRD